MEPIYERIRGFFFEQLARYSKIFEKRLSLDEETGRLDEYKVREILKDGPDPKGNRIRKLCIGVLVFFSFSFSSTIITTHCSYGIQSYEIIFSFCIDFHISFSINNKHTSSFFHWCGNKVHHTHSLRSYNCRSL